MDVNEKNPTNKNNRDQSGAIKRLGILIKDKLSEKGEREVRERLQAVVIFLLTVAVTYILSMVKLPFSAFPCSLALACSSRKHLPAVGVGILLASISGLDAVYGFTCVAIIFVRVLIALLPVIFTDFSGNGSRGSREVIPYKRDAVDTIREEEEKRENCVNEGFSRMFCESPYIKALCAASAGTLCGVFLLIATDFSLYRTFTTLVLCFSAPVLCLALGGIFGESEYKREWYRILSFATVAFLAVWGSESLHVLGMPMAPCLAMIITLYVCSVRGIALGCGAALLCGLAFEASYAPLLVLSAIVFCLISAVKRNAGVAAVCVLVVVWCYYIGGESGLLGVLPPMLLSVPIYMLADKYQEMMNAPYRREDAEGLYFAAAVTEKSKNEAVKERLSMLSETFSSLSESFYKLSNRFRRSDALGIRKITDSAFESVCEGCRNRERCWGGELGKTLEAIKQVTSRLHVSGSICKGDLPDDFLTECIREDKLINEINQATRRVTEEMINGGKISFFASNYDDITAILKDALNHDAEEYECDLKAGEQIYKLLCDNGIQSGGVVVYGKRCVHVVAKGVKNPDKLNADKSREIRKKAGEIVGAELGEPSVEIGKDGCVILMVSRSRVKASCSHGRISRDGKEWTGGEGIGDELFVDPFENEDKTCGDMTRAFITDNSYFYSLISDGMGSGAEAAYTSGVCALFIEKMLMAGNRADITLRMLNNVIRSENMGCGKECSATVDLMELDLVSGRAAFVKSGAAPTYIAREGTVYKISSRTMPVGIIKDADARITGFDTKKGDIIVMMSDGCCHDSEDCPWLVEYLCAYMTKTRKTVISTQEVCERVRGEVLQEAVRNIPEGVERDDISVSVIVVG